MHLEARLGCTPSAGAKESLSDTRHRTNPPTITCDLPTPHSDILLPACPMRTREGHASSKDAYLDRTRPESGEHDDPLSDSGPRRPQQSHGLVRRCDKWLEVDIELQDVEGEANRCLYAVHRTLQHAPSHHVQPNLLSSDVWMPKLVKRFTICSCFSCFPDTQVRLMSDLLTGLPPTHPMASALYCDTLVLS